MCWGNEIDVFAPCLNRSRKREHIQAILRLREQIEKITRLWEQVNGANWDLSTQWFALENGHSFPRH